jgi:hypothetical protein
MFWRRNGLRRPKAPQLRLLPLPDSGRMTVRGESKYQRTLHAACAGRIAPFTDEDGCWDRALFVNVALRPEPSNAYDRNAVRVDVVGVGCAGYIPRDDARAYQASLLELESRGLVGTCPGWIVRNRRAGYYAIYLHVADSATVRRAVAAAYG